MSNALEGRGRSSLDVLCSVLRSLPSIVQAQGLLYVRGELARAPKFPRLTAGEESLTSRKTGMTLAPGRRRHRGPCFNALAQVGADGGAGTG